MEKYITKEDLREIVSDLTENFMENERYSVTISLTHLSSCDTLTVQVQDREAHFKSIHYASYDIIESPCDSYDIAKSIKASIEDHEKSIDQDTVNAA